MSIEKLNKYLHKWFLNNADLDIDFSEGEYFEQETEESSITYSFTEKTPFDNIFRDVCIDIDPKAGQFNDFILSLFHEVGHIITDDDWSNKEWDKYLKYINSMPAQLTEKDYKKYYNHPIEWSATAAGVELMCDNIEATLNLQNKLKGL